MKIRVLSSLISLVLLVLVIALAAGCSSLYQAEQAADQIEEQMEQKVAKLAQAGVGQIVCPGNWSWHRLCENVNDGTVNITGMIDAGWRHGAQGVLNTN